MIDFDNALTALRLDILKLAQLERERLDLLNSPLNPAMKDERDQDFKSDIERQRLRLMKLLREVVEFPPHHMRHEQFLAQFHGVATFDKSVFVMTKFPDPKKPAPVDAQLVAVIQAVRDTVQNCGYVARIASDSQYHPILWDNVELYLLGCRRGIAIVEDKYLPELNPNVAMEWGWMRGMGRNVLYLVEKDFKKQRADWGGLIESQFDWANPGPDIKAGVQAWLK
ncbi:MAG: hypothetical protein K0Q89_1282 [Thermomicrobiales bacterium]|jgi:hypothetical protein|nr:hypothetical protein [Thermomicrobiales bacterium]